MNIRSIVLICFLFGLTVARAQECKSAVFFKEGSVLTSLKPHYTIKKVQKSLADFMGQVAKMDCLRLI